MPRFETPIKGLSPRAARHLGQLWLRRGAALQRAARACAYWLLALGCFRILANESWADLLGMGWGSSGPWALKSQGAAELALGFYLRSQFPRRRVAEASVGTLAIYLLAQVSVGLGAWAQQGYSNLGSWAILLSQLALLTWLLLTWRRAPQSMMLPSPELEDWVQGRLKPEPALRRFWQLDKPTQQTAPSDQILAEDLPSVSTPLGRAVLGRENLEDVAFLEEALLRARQASAARQSQSGQVAVSQFEQVMRQSQDDSLISRLGRRSKQKRLEKISQKGKKPEKDRKEWMRWLMRRRA